MSRPRSKETPQEASPRVLAALRHGRANAKHADQLQLDASVENERRTQLFVREAIRHLIDKGHPIASNVDCGYWIADDPEEIQECIDSLDGRIRSMLGRKSALELSRDRLMDERRRLG